MKKILTAAFAMILVLSLAGCNSESKNVPTHLTAPFGSDTCGGTNYQYIVDELEESGFKNIAFSILEDLTSDDPRIDGAVESITINDLASFSMGDEFPLDAQVKITYHIIPKLYAPLSSKELQTLSAAEISQAYTDTGFGGMEFFVPDYYEKDETKSDDTTAQFNATKGDIVALLFGESSAENITDSDFEKKKYSFTVESFCANMDLKDITNTAEENIYPAGLAGRSLSATGKFDGISTTIRVIIAHNPSKEKIIFIMLMQVGNPQYNYLQDYEEMINTATTSTSNNTSATTPNSVSYSTNDKTTVKNGNSGVYAYADKGVNYDIYYIIDFDEGYVYYFLDGNGDKYGDRLKIDSGDLNSVLIITYHDGGDVWSYGLHFKWKNQPDHLIVEGEDGFEADFYPTDLDDALTIRDSKIIKDF